MSGWDPYRLGGPSGSGEYEQLEPYSLDTRTKSTIDSYMSEGVNDWREMMRYVPNANPDLVRHYMGQVLALQREADEPAARYQAPPRYQAPQGRSSDSTGRSYGSDELREKIRGGIPDQVLNSGYEYYDNRNERRRRLTNRRTEEDLRGRARAAGTDATLEARDRGREIGRRANQGDFNPVSATKSTIARQNREQGKLLPETRAAFTTLFNRGKIKQAAERYDTRDREIRYVDNERPPERVPQPPAHPPRPPRPTLGLRTQSLDPRRARADVPETPTEDSPTGYGRPSADSSRAVRNFRMDDDDDEKTPRPFYTSEKRFPRGPK
jgi:hypothetical protein